MFLVKMSVFQVFATVALPTPCPDPNRTPGSRRKKLSFAVLCLHISPVAVVASKLPKLHSLTSLRRRVVALVVPFNVE